MRICKLMPNMHEEKHTSTNIRARKHTQSCRQVLFVIMVYNHMYLQTSKYTQPMIYKHAHICVRMEIYNLEESFVAYHLMRHSKEWVIKLT